MATRLVARATRWLVVATLVGGLWTGWLAPQPAEAGKLDQLDASLKLIPENAAFYGAMLRNREQIEAVASSQAWAKLKQMPIAQMGWSMYLVQASMPGSVPFQIQQALANPQTRNTIDLLGDMLSEEVFLYGDEGCVDFFKLLQETVSRMRYGQLMGQLTREMTGQRDEQLQARLMIAALVENLQQIKIPNLVAGFKLSDTQRATEQLAQLEALAKPVLDANPQTKGRLQRSKIGKYEYLTLSLDAAMIPWDQVPIEKLKELESKSGDAEKLIARLKQLTLVIALGVREKYLMLSIGPSTDCLARLGEGKRLSDRAELKPLERFADRRLVSIGYASKALTACMTTSKQDIDGLLNVVRGLLVQVQLPPAQRERIQNDAAALAKDLKTMIPEAGATMAFGFLTDQGTESLTYNWGEQLGLDGSKPLALLEHLGGDPLLAVVGRSKHSPGDYDVLVKWLRMAYGYFEDFAVPQMPPEPREKFQKAVALLRPLLERLDTANRQMLLPALADGQAALVLDAKLQSKRFLQHLPATDKPMPMLEPAVVLGVSDAQLLRKAVAEYQAVIKDAVQALREIEPKSVPEFKFPKPKHTTVQPGEIWAYALPKELGVDKAVAPNAGLSEKVAVLSASPKQTERLLRPTSLKAGGVLADTGRPLALAVYCNWAEMVDAATPWVELAVTEIVKQQSPSTDPEDHAGQTAGVMAQVRTVLDVLKVLRNVTSVAYFEDGALVYHTRVEIRDVK